MLKKVILWILLILCMGTIFFFSSQEATESKKASSGLIVAIVRFFDFDNSLTENEIQIIKENLTFIVRKSAHFSMYFVFGILIFLQLNEYGVKGKKALPIAVILAMLYAVSDEFHQSFVKGRSGELRDVLIDTAGAFSGCTAVSFIKCIFRRKSE